MDLLCEHALPSNTLFYRCLTLTLSALVESKSDKWVAGQRCDKKVAIRPR